MTIATTTLSLSEIFLEHRGYLRGIAQKIVRTADLADDVLQEAYLKLAKGSYAEEVRKPLSYCCQVVRNLAIDHFRKHAVEAALRADGEDVELLEVPGDVGPEQSLGERQSLALIEEVLATLSPRTRLAFELYRISGMTQRDIGLQLGCSATLVNFMIKEVDQALEGCRHLLK